MVHIKSALTLLFNLLGMANALNKFGKVFFEIVGTANANKTLSKSNLWQFLLRERFVRQPSGCRTFFWARELLVWFNSGLSALRSTLPFICQAACMRLSPLVSAKRCFAKPSLPFLREPKKQIRSGNHQVVGHFFGGRNPALNCHPLAYSLHLYAC